MKKIRKHVFETNSSSMHSLVVVKHPKPYNSTELKMNCYHEDRDYCLFGWGSDEAEFGRAPFKVLRDPQDKLRYWVAHEIGMCEKMDQIPVIKEFISKHTGVPVGKIDIRANAREHDKKRDYYGYIEHNDTGESPFEYIHRKKITMEEFIMNPKYLVVVDGDEYCEFKKLFESNLMNAEDFEDISSGAEFWNESTKYMYVGWLRPDRWNHVTDPAEAVDEVSEFTKKFIVKLDSEDYGYYNADTMREICRLAKEKNPKIVTILANSDYDSAEKGMSQTKLDALDKTMFDQVTLKPVKKRKENED